jgi:alkylresorcinol/alkylpyrone synthase
MEEALDAPPPALQKTWDSLRNIGNLSSASVLFILRDTLLDSGLTPQKRGVMISFGPGVCAEFVLLNHTK